MAHAQGGRALVGEGVDAVGAGDAFLIRFRGAVLGFQRMAAAEAIFPVAFREARADGDAAVEDVAFAVPFAFIGGDGFEVF